MYCNVRWTMYNNLSKNIYINQLCLYLLCSLSAHGQRQLQLQLLLPAGLRSGLLQFGAGVGGSGCRTNREKTFTHRSRHGTSLQGNMCYLR